MVETYLPKTNSNYFRFPQPLTLKFLALRSLLAELSQTKITSLKLKERVEKSGIFREFLGSMLPKSLIRDMLRVAQVLFYKPHIIVNILHVIPTAFLQNSVDVLGYYDGTECCSPLNTMNWLYGYIPDVRANLQTCRDLYQLIRTIDPSKLKTFQIWPDERAFKRSCLPIFLSKATNLTRLALRGDADDSLLRSIGLNCVCLKYLDISRSARLSFQGIRNLILRRPFSPRVDLFTGERNPCAKTLDELIIPSVEAGEWKNYLDVCLLLHNCYLFTRMPDLVYRREGKNSVASELEPIFINNLNFGTDKIKHELRRTLTHWTGEEGGRLVFDIFKDGGCSGDLKIFGRYRNTFHLNLVLKVRGELGITTMELFWDNFSWDLGEIMTFPQLFTLAPNIERFDGRICEEPNNNLTFSFKFLTEIHAWVLDDSTAITILKSCPCLQIVDIRNIRYYENEGSPLLNHAVLQDLIEEFPTMWSGMREFMVRPTNLVAASVLLLNSKCKCLRRVGDLECWEVSEEEISELNSYLNNSHSQIVLVVLSFPPNAPPLTQLI